MRTHRDTQLQRKVGVQNGAVKQALALAARHVQPDRLRARLLTQSSIHNLRCGIMRGIALIFVWKNTYGGKATLY